MVVDLETPHSLRPGSVAAFFPLCLFLSDMLFHVTMNDFCKHLDIAAAEVVYADCLESREAHRLVFRAVRDCGQIQELGSGTRLAQLDQHIVAKVEFLQSLGEILEAFSQ